MSAPTPWNGPLPLLFTGGFQKRQFGVGSAYAQTWIQTPGSITGGTVFDNLVSPPTNGINSGQFSGILSEQTSLAWAQSVGTALLTWNVRAGQVTTPASSGTQANDKSAYTPLIVAKMVAKNFDPVMNFYLESSIVRSGGVPVA